jgi:hypothetical protein
MYILAHRGQWKERSEQNTLKAIELAFHNGYGVETDLRDYHGQIIISHDCPERDDLPTLDDLLSLYKAYDMSVPLALNVKSDGLQQQCVRALKKADIQGDGIFFFDMSIPDALVYLKNDLPCFTRYSDEEPVPSFLDRACGVWLDGFATDCTDKDIIFNWLKADLKVCLVSPELHKRNQEKIWSKWRSFLENTGKSVMICTDFPQEADRFFNG